MTEVQLLNWLVNVGGVLVLPAAITIFFYLRFEKASQANQKRMDEREVQHVQSQKELTASYIDSLSTTVSHSVETMSSIMHSLQQQTKVMTEFQEKTSQQHAQMTEAMREVNQDLTAIRNEITRQFEGMRADIVAEIRNQNQQQTPPAKPRR